MIPETESPQSQHDIPKRLTIAYMTDGIFSAGGYQFTLWKGICEAAQQNGINLVCFTGGSLNINPGYEFEYQRNSVFDLITKACFDGLIISSSTLKYGISQQEISDYYAKYKNLAVVSLGLAMEDFPSIGIDNRSGAKELTNHLIEAHGYRRIAFIRGPEENGDAEERFDVYKEALAEHSIPLDMNLVVQGGFRREGGETAVRILLDENRAKFDAILSANDGMALGAMGTLQARGLRIPDDVAVTGFDDIPDAQLCFPPLTTVSQPILEIGRVLVNKLLKILYGEEVSGCEMIPSQAVIRNSCGCMLKASSINGWRTRAEASQVSAPIDPENLMAAMVDVLECPEEQRELASEQAAILAEGVQSAWMSLREGSGRIGEIGEKIGRTIRTLPQLPWHRVLTILSETSWWQEASQLDPTQHAWFWRDIWQTYSEMSRLSHSYTQIKERFQRDGNADNFRDVSQALASTFDLSELTETIYTQLPRLGINSCWISLYDQDEVTSENAQLILAFNRNGRIALGSGREFYPACWLLPKDVFTFDCYSAVYTNALYFRETRFGFAIFGLDEPDQNIIDTISSQISTALQRIHVMDELKLTQTELRRQANTDPLTGIYNRRMVYNLVDPLFELARRHHRLLGVLMIDLDDFKMVNDLHGHSVGDQVLQGFCDFVKHNIRATDIFGRFGGEEFIIILPDTSEEETNRIGDRLCVLISRNAIQVGEKSISLTVSIGGTSTPIKLDQSIDNLIYDADNALYQAKQAGKNQMKLFKNEPLERS